MFRNYARAAGAAARAWGGRQAARGGVRKAVGMGASGVGRGLSMYGGMGDIGTAALLGGVAGGLNEKYRGTDPFGNPGGSFMSGAVGGALLGMGGMGAWKTGGFARREYGAARRMMASTNPNFSAGQLRARAAALTADATARHIGSTLTKKATRIASNLSATGRGIWKDIPNAWRDVKAARAAAGR